MNRERPFTDKRRNANRMSKNFLPPPQAIGLIKTQERKPEHTHELTLRLDRTAYAALKDMAVTKGLSVPTLVSMWVRERLAGNASA
jgi:hypothetical protein